MSVEELGKKLLAEVEEIGLDEILIALRLKDTSTTSSFGLQPLDGLLRTASEAWASSSKSSSAMPVIELMSLRLGDGKTHLLYFLTAIAVLPTNLGGKQNAVVILDTDGSFSIERLAQQIKQALRPTMQNDTSKDEQESILLTALNHVHIYRPQSLASTIATIHSLSRYLFNPTKHHSFDRAISFIALDSASSFYWQNRAEVETTSLLDSTSGARPPSSQPTGYVQLAAALKNASRAFSAPVIFTTSHNGPFKPSPSFDSDAHSFRPSLPAPWHTLPTLRLVVQRIPVRKLPVEINIQGALRESEARSKVVGQGRFACFVNEWGLDERTLQKFHASGSGFAFFIGDEGVRLEGEAVS